MTRTRGIANHRHPSMTIVWLSPQQRLAVADALARTCTRFDIDGWRRAAHASAGRRREVDASIIAGREAELEVLASRQASAELALEDLRREQLNLVDAAEWCERQPAEDAAGATRLADLTAEVEEQGRVARVATRRLERVLEQRAAAEAALEEARRELAGLGSAGADETTVRRQIEAASEELRAATDTYQAAMKDAARRRIALGQVETSPDAATTASFGVGDDQLRAMGRALSDKLAGTAARVDDRRLVEANEAVELAEAQVDAAAGRVAAARQRIASLEDELRARSHGEDVRDVRHQAAAELEAQVSSVEHRLHEAEATARTEVDDATRAVSRAELSLDRIRQESRERRRRLAELLALVPVAERPTVEEDIVERAAEIGAALRTMTEPMQEDAARAEEGIRRLQAVAAETSVDIEARRAALGTVMADDRIAALRQILDGVDGLVLLDDVVSADTDAQDSPSTTDLGSLADPTVPMIVLTTDSDVAAWAIDLPAERGEIVPVAALEALTNPEPSGTDRQQMERSPC